MSRLEAHSGFFRLLMKGILDPFFDKKLISLLVTRVRTHNYMIIEILPQLHEHGVKRTH